MLDGHIATNVHTQGIGYEWPVSFRTRYAQLGIATLHPPLDAHVTLTATDFIAGFE